MPHDEQQLVEFLCGDEWPFHARTRVTPDDVAGMEFVSSEVASFWMHDDGDAVGLVRILDLGDIGAGAPLFDLRVASRHRGRGLGKRATRWIADHLFTSYPELHRIEANTRHDNDAMQRVLADVGFTLEGRLSEAWWSDDGRWFDTMIYGLLRRDWTST